jgi:hypothetical protein
MSNETVRIIIEHDDAEGNRLSTLHLTYPTMDNVVANVLQLDLVEGLAKQLRGYSKDKAKALGLVWPEG